eukprot:TRINITY_DN12585_c0_g1_i1.p1 TRINITY_DN12585_c0_g1~~TRINITY_DN12585_c0_g1_i1.p1  ORF type:complete len:361 (-),score=81.41 TRINITY_DN12585_c0_g1_i1:76-1158(-)
METNIERFFHNLEFQDFDLSSWSEQLQQEEVIGRIEAHTFNFLLWLTESQQPPPIQVISRKELNVTERRESFRLGKLVQECFFFSSTKRYCRIWKVLSFVHRLLGQKKKATQREANKAIQAAVDILQCPRDSLGIMAASRGKIIGQIRIREAQTWVDCSKLEACGKIIPGDLSSIVELSTTAKYLLVVEKEAIFRRLAEDKLFLILPLILVTASGFPDLATRILVYRIKAHFPSMVVLGLFDCDVSGFEIFLSYRMGSVFMGLETFKWVVDMKWLGLHHSDLQEFEIPQSCLLRLTAKESKKLEKILNLQFIQNRPQYAEQLRNLQSTTTKAELECLHHFGYNFISNVYLPRKILKNSYF